MSTVSKGDLLEDLAYEVIRKELEKNNLGISPAHSKLHKKHSYYSKDREKDIVVDLSIEVWLPDAENYSLLWIGECKNYNHSIPIDDVEEFKAKLDQIAGKNIKGVMIIKTALQTSAYTYAKNNGIGVIKIMPDDKAHWVLYQMTSNMLENKLNPNEFNQAMVNANHESFNRDFYSFYDGYIFGDVFSLLKYQLNLSQ